MALTTALANSCDTYFYEVALRAYEPPTRRSRSGRARWASASSTGIDVGPESDGLVPTPAWRRSALQGPREQVWTNGDSVQLAIGQGDLLVTPLQMTRLYAMLANGGKLVEPHVVKAIEEPRNEGAPPLVLRPFTPEAAASTSASTRPRSRSSRKGSTTRRTQLRDVHERVRRLPDPDRGQDRHGGEVRPAARLRRASATSRGGAARARTTKPELVVCALIENGGHGGDRRRAGRAQGVRALLRGRARHLRRPRSEESD